MKNPHKGRDNIFLELIHTCIIKGAMTEDEMEKQIRVREEQLMRDYQRREEEHNHRLFSAIVFLIIVIIAAMTKR